MANLKETRNRIVSVNSTMQITSAMKMVSAAKLKKATDAVSKMRPYAEKLKEILVNLSADTSGDSQSEYSDVRDVNKVLVVPVTSNRGLCGGFNANIIKGTVKLIKEKYDNKEVSLLCVGKKAGDWFTNKGYNVVRSEVEIFNDLTFANSSVIAEEIMSSFVTKEYDEVIFVYNQFVNAATQSVQFEKILPVSNDEADGAEASVIDYTYEPDRDAIVLDLIPKALKTQFFKGVLDSVASEHGARMTAMHQATDNAESLSKALKLEYNKARQAAITTEILEIVGGAEALNG
ncbi:MAG: F-type H+-transporting ATPase subunit gamma [Glaciecola sp.]|jgi:F-type H+-transporting ATPase subunit gamma